MHVRLRVIIPMISIILDYLEFNAYTYLAELKKVLVFSSVVYLLAISVFLFAKMNNIEALKQQIPLHCTALYWKLVFASRLLFDFETKKKRKSLDGIPPS